MKACAFYFYSSEYLYLKNFFLLLTLQLISVKFYFYVPAFDFINMPRKERFKTSGDYYCTLFHEMAHWTGHKNRLDRDFKGRFGDESYAFEELIAEMGSAFLFADLGLEGNVQHDSYIASWLRVLKNDKKAIFKAATEASKAHQFILKSTDAKEDKLEEAA